MDPSLSAADPCGTDVIKCVRGTRSVLFTFSLAGIMSVSSGSACVENDPREFEMDRGRLAAHGDADNPFAKDLRGKNQGTKQRVHWDGGMTFRMCRSTLVVV